MRKRRGKRREEEEDEEEEDEEDERTRRRKRRRTREEGRCEVGLHKCFDNLVGVRCRRVGTWMVTMRMAT